MLSYSKHSSQIIIFQVLSLTINIAKFEEDSFVQNTIPSYRFYVLLHITMCPTLQVIPRTMAYPGDIKAPHKSFIAVPLAGSCTFRLSPPNPREIWSLSRSYLLSFCRAFCRETASKCHGCYSLARRGYSHFILYFLHFDFWVPKIHCLRIHLGFCRTSIIQ